MIASQFLIDIVDIDFLTYIFSLTSTPRAIPLAVVIT